MLTPSAMNTRESNSAKGLTFPPSIVNINRTMTPKKRYISLQRYTAIPEIGLIRTDTTLDLSQKAEKV